MEYPRPWLKIYEQYKEYVWYLQHNGLVDGYPDGTFWPDRQVTRAELIY